jgi:hypothetical protein
MQQTAVLKASEKRTGVPWKRARATFIHCGQIVSAILVLLVLANVVLFAAFKLKDVSNDAYGGSTRVLERYPLPVLATAYPGYSQDDVRTLLHETWDHTLEFQPFAQVKERARTGKWVNVDPNGFRRSANNGPWPPDARNTNIFMFGGSTTFGYGVADNETIASHLQDHLAKKTQSPRDVKVYNFGVGYYYSTQERVLFCTLLTHGFVPDIAVFIDGVNDFAFIEDRPVFSNTLSAVMNGASIERGEILEGPLSWLPMSRFARWTSTRLGWQQAPTRESSPSEKRDEKQDKFSEVIRRYFANKRLSESAARAYGVKPVFVWQPAPNYKYNLAYHFLHSIAFAQSKKHYDAQILAVFGGQRQLHYGYGLMAKTLAERSDEQKKDLLWLADIQEHATRSLYVDVLHYNGEFNREIAGHIARFLAAQGICCGADERQATAMHAGRTNNPSSSLHRE